MSTHTIPHPPSGSGAEHPKRNWHVTARQLGSGRWEAVAETSADGGSFGGVLYRLACRRGNEEDARAAVGAEIPAFEALLALGGEQ